MDGADLSAALQSRRVASRLLRKVTDDLVIFPTTSRPERREDADSRRHSWNARVSQPVKNRDDEHSWIVFETTHVSSHVRSSLVQLEQTVFFIFLSFFFFFFFFFYIAVVER